MISLYAMLILMAIAIINGFLLGVLVSMHTSLAVRRDFFYRAVAVCCVAGWLITFLLMVAPFLLTLG